MECWVSLICGINHHCDSLILTRLCPKRNRENHGVTEGTEKRTENDKEFQFPKMRFLKIGEGF